MNKSDLPDMTFEKKRELEHRQCPQCRYTISNPLTDRCPRCFSFVERIETECGECTHQANCEIAHILQSSKMTAGT